MALAILCYTFVRLNFWKVPEAAVLLVPLFQELIPLFRKKQVLPGVPINRGKWTFPMLLAEPARLCRCGGMVFEIESFLPIFCLCTETISLRSEELNCARRPQDSAVFANHFLEAFLVLEIMAYT